MHLRWASLVNIVAGEEVVPELIQDGFTVENLEREGADLLVVARSGSRRCGRASRAWRPQLGPPGERARRAPPEPDVLVGAAAP